MMCLTKSPLRFKVLSKNTQDFSRLRKRRELAEREKGVERLTNIIETLEIGC